MTLPLMLSVRGRLTLPLMLSVRGMLSVRLLPPMVVAPSKPTPHEFKPLSDIDDQDGFRFRLPVIQYYRHQPLMRGKNPATILRHAVAEALVFYYPLAGRLREWPGRKLVVECTGEGVDFVEADSDMSLEQFGHSLLPPNPGSEQFVPAQGPFLDSPVISIQVTRLRCGGFIFGLRINHAMADGSGMVQFMDAIADIARGACSPSVMPVWERELLIAQNPPQVTQAHPEFSGVLTGPRHVSEEDNLVTKSFIFSPKDVSKLKQHLSSNLINRSSTFEVLTACVWRSRTMSLCLDAADEVRFLFFADFRGKRNPPLPVGFYGNAVSYPGVVSTAGELASNPLSYAVNLIKEAKGKVTHEHTCSLANLMVVRGRAFVPVIGRHHTYYVSDVSRVGFSEVDFGWGKPVFGGPATGVLEAFPCLLSFFCRFRNDEGEESVVVPMSLPRPFLGSSVSGSRFESKSESESESDIQYHPMDRILYVDAVVAASNINNPSDLSSFMTAATTPFSLSSQNKSHCSYFGDFGLLVVIHLIGRKTILISAPGRSSFRRYG